MRIIPFILAIAALIFAAQPSNSEGKTDRFIQDRFVISFWGDPPARETTDARYKELADANFTMVMNVFGPQTPKEISKMLSLCKKYGLTAIIRADVSKPETLLDHPNCWGYYLCDEPGAGRIPEIKATIGNLRKIRPSKLGYFNLYPNYCPTWGLETSSYDEYIARFARETDCDVLCMDHYPLMTPGTDNRQGYCDNLETMRKYSVERGIPFWNFFNSMPFGIHFDPTEAQLRWQVYTSLAYGAKGVLYFLYWSASGPVGEFQKSGGILGPEGERTRHYEQVKRINAGLKNLGPTIMKLTSTRVIRIKYGEDPAKVLDSAPIKNITPGDYLIGVFKHSDGRRAVLLNNFDHAYTSWPTVTFDVGDKEVIEVDAADGKEKPARDDSRDIAGLQLSLDSGEGRLFLLPAKRIR